MRFKITGKLTPKLLSQILEKELTQRGWDSFYGANLYFGSGDEVFEFNIDKPVKQDLPRGEDPMKKRKPKTQWPSRVQKGKQPKKNIALTDQWEPKMGAVQPANAIQMNDKDLPF